MARVFRPEYTRPVPPDAETRVRGGKTEVRLTLKGRKPAWYEVREVAPVKRKGKLHPGGRRAVVPLDVWYVEYPDPAAPRGVAREKGYRDRAATEALLIQRLRDVERRRAGLRDPDAGDAARPLAELLAEYLALLDARGSSPGHRRNVQRHVSAAVAGAGWHTFRQVTPDSLTLYLGRLRAAPKRAGARTAGTANATLNTVIRDCKAFAAWLSRRLKAFDPLDGFAGFNPEVGRRRSRHILSDDEFDKLVAAAEAGPPVKLTAGPDRAMVYRVAAYTGFRAGELEILTPAHFDLDAAPPVVSLEAGEDKSDRGVGQPLPGWLAEKLRAYLAGRDRKGHIWPGLWATRKRQRHWLARDLAAAGLPLLDPTGRPVNFHSLRRRFVTGVAESGANPKELQELARHSSPALTLQVYAQAKKPRLGEIVDKLPGGR